MDSLVMRQVPVVKEFGMKSNCDLCQNKERPKGKIGNRYRCPALVSDRPYGAIGNCLNYIPNEDEMNKEPNGNLS